VGCRARRGTTVDDASLTHVGVDTLADGTTSRRLHRVLAVPELLRP
jgi:hypothetical protein